MTLLHRLAALRGAYGLTLSAAHVNHGLRPEARADEDFVTELCAAWGVELRVFSVDVPRSRAGQTTEEAARRLRYDCLRAAMKEQNAAKIATAHNRDDNAETVLLHMLRGAGLQGLCGIPPVRAIDGGAIIRPLLDTPRAEILTYLRKNGLDYRTDASNFDETYARNRMRHSVLPLIKRHINAQAAEVITRNAAGLRDEEALLAALARDAYAACAVEGGLDVAKLTALPVALQRRVVRLAAGAARPGGLTDLHAGHIAQVLDIARGGAGRETYLPDGLRVCRAYGRLVFSSAPPEGGFSYALLPERPVFIPTLGKTARLTLSPPVSQNCAKTFSYDRVSAGLCLRTRLPGDRLYISGVGTRKLQDYFTDTKTPRALRDGVPLLACGRDILWVMDERGRADRRYAPQDGETVCWVCIEE